MHITNVNEIVRIEIPDLQIPEKAEISLRVTKTYDDDIVSNFFY